MTSKQVDRLIEEIGNVAYNLKYLGNGNASTQFGAIEGHSMQVKEGLETLASAVSSAGGEINISDLPTAIEGAGRDIKDGLLSIAAAINDAG